MVKNIMSDSLNYLPISFEHQEDLSLRWRRLCVEGDLLFAEYSFANTFLFRRQHRYVYVNSDPPFVRGEFAEGGYYYIPTVYPRDCLDVLSRMKEGKKTLFPISEGWLNEFPPPYQASFQRNDSDYLYRTEKMRTLAGGALSSRRNLLYQFESHYVVESRTLTSAEIPNALKILEEWQAQAQQPKEETDYFSCRDALEFFEALGLTGRIAYADGVPVGFIVGELLTPAIALFHLSKSIHNYKGVTPFLYQDFAKHLPDTVEWINLEQDLGILSLRKAKEAYDPDRLVPKYRMTMDGTP